MKKFGTLLAAAAVVSLGAMPAGIGALPFGGEAHAQGQSAAGKAKGNSGVSRGGRSAEMSGGRGNGARQGGLSMDVPGVRGNRTERGGRDSGARQGDLRMDQPVVRGNGSAHHDRRFDDRQFGGRTGRGDVFPSGARKFGAGFCPPGLADKGCVPPGLQGFARGDRIPEHVSFDRIFHGDYGLPAPRADQYYGRIDNDAYLMSGATRQVIETIDLLGRTRR